MMSIGQRIKECRELLKMTQESLANKIGTTKQTIYKYENDIITNIPPDKVELLAKALAISPAYLMGWIDNDAGKEERMKDYKEFKSIHVDLEKGIYLLNGEPMKYVTEMNLMLDGERWSLGINKYEWFKEGSRRTPSSIARTIRDTGASIRGEMKETIKNASTKELVDELVTREGVEMKYAEPHKDLDVNVNGPAIVLIVVD